MFGHNERFTNNVKRGQMFLISVWSVGADVVIDYYRTLKRRQTRTLVLGAREREQLANGIAWVCFPPNP